MSDSFSTKGSVILHAIAVTVAVALVSGQFQIKPSPLKQASSTFPSPITAPAQR